MSNMSAAKVTRRVVDFDEQVEVGDFAREIGQIYMHDLKRAVRNHEKYKRDKIRFAVHIKKNPNSNRELHVRIVATMHLFQKMYHSMAIWEYDYRKNHLSLLWSLPHPSEMKMFMMDPDKYDKDLINWIRKYVKQEKLDLKKATGIRVKVK